MKVTEQLFLSAFGAGVTESRRMVDEFNQLKADYVKFKGIHSEQVNKEKFAELKEMAADHKKLRSYLYRLKRMSRDYLEETNVEFIENI